MSLLTQASDEVFTELVESSLSVAEIERKLGYHAYSGCVSTKINARIKELELDTSHFSVNQKEVWTPEKIFVKDSKATQKTLRKYFKSGGYVPYVCSICGQEPEWNGKPLTLILDHINGLNNGDRLENLRWVCPNCNQQLDTTGSKNRAYKDL